MRPLKSPKFTLLDLHTNQHERTYHMTPVTIEMAHWNNAHWNNAHWNNAHWNNAHWNNAHWNNSVQQPALEAHAWGNHAWGNHAWGNHAWGNHAWGNHAWGNSVFDGGMKMRSNREEAGRKIAQSKQSLAQLVRNRGNVVSAVLH